MGAICSCSTPQPPTNAKMVKEAIAGIKAKFFHTPHAAAKATGAPRRTVYDRYNGRPTYAEASVAQQTLSAEQEHALVKHISAMTSTGFPVSHQFLRELAEELRKSTPPIDGKPYSPLGVNWVTRFLKRHSHLQIVMTRNIELKRLTETRKDVMIDFYMQFDKVVKEFV